MTDQRVPATIACAECGILVDCRPGPECWCAALPPQPMGAEGAGCLCPDCLARRAARLRDASAAGRA